MPPLAAMAFPQYPFEKANKRDAVKHETDFRLKSVFLSEFEDEVFDSNTHRFIKSKQAPIDANSADMKL